MSPSIADKRASFRSLHESGCFVIPNPWDAGSAVMLQQLGFKAVASTSAGMAWTLGRPDNGVTRGDALTHLRELVAAVDLPVNADYENAFADDPDGVATSIALAADTGIAGGVLDLVWTGIEGTPGMTRGSVAAAIGLFCSSANRCRSSASSVTK